MYIHNHTTLYTYTYTTHQHIMQNSSFDIPNKEQAEEHHPTRKHLLILVAAVVASLSCGPQTTDVTWWVEGGGRGSMG